jgi:hypothetical protein
MYPHHIPCPVQFALAHSLSLSISTVLSGVTSRACLLLSPEYIWNVTNRDVSTEKSDDVLESGRLWATMVNGQITEQGACEWAFMQGLSVAPQWSGAAKNGSRSEAQTESSSASHLTLASSASIHTTAHHGIGPRSVRLRRGLTSHLGNFHPSRHRNTRHGNGLSPLADWMNFNH